MLVLMGVALVQMGETSKPLINTLDLFLQGLFKIVAMVMRLAPIGAGAGMAVGDVGQQGPARAADVVGQALLGDGDVFGPTGGATGLAEVQRPTGPQHIVFAEQDALDRDVVGKVGYIILDEWGDPAIAVELVDGVGRKHPRVLGVNDLDVGPVF